MPKTCLVFFLQTNQFSICQSLNEPQSQHFRKGIFPYIGSLRSGKMVLVIFLRFLNFGLFFGPFLGTEVKNAKLKKVAPGNSLKILASKFRSKLCFFKMYIFEAPIESEGPGMVSS